MDRWHRLWRHGRRDIEGRRFWDQGLVPREDLEAVLGGCLDPVPVHELVVVTDPSLGDTVLAEGCHMYAVARDLGVGELPVRRGRWEDWFEDDDGLSA